jgi:YggT family protein
MGVRGLIIDLLELYEVVIVLYVVMSWFPVTNPGGPMDHFRYFLHRATDPVLGPIRRLIPSVGGAGLRLDLSPLIVLLLIQLILVPILSR